MTTAARWALPLLLREATRNVLNVRSRMFSSVLLATVFGSATAAFSALDAHAFNRQLQQLQAMGSNVVSFESASPNTTVLITRSSCEALAQDGGVQRAGLLIDDGIRDVPELGARVSTYSASPSLFPRLRSADGVLGVALGSSNEPRRITIEGAGTRLLVAGLAQPEGIPTNTGVIFPLPAGTTAASACTVVLDQFASPHVLASSLAAELVVTGGDIMPIRRLTPTLDPVAQWRARPGQYVAPALGLAGGLCVTLLTWTRSGEMAAYRLSGTRRAALATILTCEALLTASVFATAGIVAATTLARFYISATEVFLWIFAGSAIWVLAAAAGVVRSIVVGAITLTRER
ncbi:hypothetical protein ACFOYW_09140 [Gryllotalpicola reticulitermitis]|uniref:FtsX-like permease family protein n=1 Tax=Gryllotalpicola reticulitermitis TaxID=1184153 RepID=A0ABV8Q7G2_9MICO